LALANIQIACISQNLIEAISICLSQQAF